MPSRFVDADECDIARGLTSVPPGSGDSTSRITTLPQLIEALGGAAAVAEWCDVPEASISCWLAQGRAPNGYHLRLYLRAEAAGWRVEPITFELLHDGEVCQPA